MFNNFLTAFTTPTLVLQKFYVGQAQEGNYVNITGRPPGFVALLLNMIGLEGSTTLSVTKNNVRFRNVSLFGETHLFAPLNQIASTECGYTKPIGLLLVGGLLVLFGLSGLFSGDGGALFGGLVMIVIGGVIAAQYFFRRRITITLETTGGKSFGLAFRRGLVENVDVTLEDAVQVINVVNQLVNRSTRQQIEKPKRGEDE